MVIWERLETVPPGFSMHGAAPGDQMLNLRLALVQTDISGLEDALMAVSTPTSTLYGQFLPKEEVEKFVAPTQETVDSVTAYLSEHGLSATPFSPAGDWLSLNLTVAQANVLFDTQFSTFVHVKTGITSVRTLEYSIPAALQGHLDFVHPTITFPQPASRQSLVSISLPKGVDAAATTGGEDSGSVPASCRDVITPACLQALYGIPTTKTSLRSSVLGVSGFVGQFSNRADLKAFLEAFRPDLPPADTFAFESVDGGQNSQNISQAGVEADFDIQYSIGLASGVPVTFISVGPANSSESNADFVASLQDIMLFLLGQKSPPNVLTTSYGLNEADVSQPLAISICNLCLQLGARGTSILFSSGDGGVGGSQPEDCTTFQPTFPPGCPYVTSVGGTTDVPETSADFSSGGFSNYFRTPSYQASVVSDYLAKLGARNRGLFSATGRAFPDVSAQAGNFSMIWKGEQILVTGTSASSPTFASVIALLNDELIAAGKSPLGFLNPFLYTTGRNALNDVTTGSNPGCNTSGFPAAEGWDPVTGLGTPNFAALRKAVGL
ncbi:family S53 protease [Artomyces pyxidatus]|uniref:Family S53 protease n=1 Tax=Artomyces pyxidatus TaxID=48021 RepID=A0ACB8SHM7_9AGAM|nr:family S53 protease [Artomyces pyxidatus]